MLASDFRIANFLHLSNFPRGVQPTMTTSRATSLAQIASSSIRNASIPLAFLYLTPTILNRSSRSVGAFRKHARTRSSLDGPVGRHVESAPSLEKSDLASPNTISESSERRESSVGSQAYHRNQTSTMTKKERDIFEKLFAQAIIQPSQPVIAKKSTENVEREYEETVDEILQGAMKENAEGGQRATKTTGPQYQWPSSLQDIAEEVEKRALKQRKSALKENTEVEEEQVMTKADVLRRQEYKRIEQLIRKSETDTELWNVLETEVFAAIRTLGLGAKEEEVGTLHDELATLSDLTAKQQVTAADFTILGPNYPSILVVALRQLRHHFPSSSLPLAILPAMKALGRESFVLGASTLLYNELIVFLWLKYGDFQGINDLLQEMDNGVVDFDENTLDILDSIRSQMQDANDGRFGPTFRAVWNMDSFRRGAGRLGRWRQLIRSRIEDDALRKASNRVPNI